MFSEIWIWVLTALDLVFLFSFSPSSLFCSILSSWGWVVLFGWIHWSTLGEHPCLVNRAESPRAWFFHLWEDFGENPYSLNGYSNLLCFWGFVGPDSLGILLIYLRHLHKVWEFMEKVWVDFGIFGGLREVLVMQTGQATLIRWPGQFLQSSRPSDQRSRLGRLPTRLDYYQLTRQSPSRSSWFPSRAQPGTGQAGLVTSKADLVAAAALPCVFCCVSLRSLILRFHDYSAIFYSGLGGYPGTNWLESISRGVFGISWGA